MWLCRQFRFRTRSNRIVCSLFILTSVAILWQYKLMNPNSLTMPMRRTLPNLENSQGASSGSKWIQGQQGARPVSKWIVMTSAIHPPNEQIERISRTAGWNLLVVADKGMPRIYRKHNIIILDMDAQQKLSYRVLKYLPSNLYTRKIIGYLYAIQHGAEFIYDYGPENPEDNVSSHPIAFQEDFVFERATRGLILNNYNDNVVANPYIHFGQPSVWPRGFPLEYIAQNYNYTYTVCRMVTPVIQQGIMNGDLDPDTIRRLTRRTLFRPSVEFDIAAPPIIFPSRVLAPFNSKNTVFHYDAFWAMLLPVSVDFRAMDIWRSYRAQPLLWSIGRNLGFYSTNTIQIRTNNRNPDSYLRNFKEEDNLYKKSGALVKFLANWRCLSHDLYECMLELTSTLFEQRMWSFSEIELMEAWINDLKSIGYKPPSIIRDQYHEHSSPCLNENEKTFAMFNGVEMQSNVVADQDVSRVVLRKFCTFPIPTTEEDLTVDRVHPYIFPSTLLVITFNNPHYDAIWLLDIIYRPHYPNILYCGHLENANEIYSFLAKKTFSAVNVKKFSFVHANVGSSYVYDCALRAIDMNYNVNGYIHVSDDVLFNFWNNRQLNPEEPWLFNSFSTLSTALPLNQTTWPHWAPFYGASAIANALNEIYNHSSELNIHVKQFVKNREMYGYNSSIAMVSAVDIYYFPVSKQDMVYEVGSILRKYSVYLEISVPFLLTGLSPPSDIGYMSGTSLWDNNRTIPFSFFNASHSALHPVKLSQVVADSSLTKDYCDNYVALILQL